MFYASFYTYVYCFLCYVSVLSRTVSLSVAVTVMVLIISSCKKDTVKAHCWKRQGLNPLKVVISLLVNSTGDATKVQFFSAEKFFFLNSWSVADLQFCLPVLIDNISLASSCCIMLWLLFITHPQRMTCNLKNPVHCLVDFLFLVFVVALFLMLFQVSYLVYL